MVLIVGTKLQVIITKLGLRIQEKGDVVRGAPLVKPGDDLFWFDKPSFMLFLIHLVLFTVRFTTRFILFFWFSFSLIINLWVLNTLHFPECISTCFLCMEFGKRSIYHFFFKKKFSNFFEDVVLFLYHEFLVSAVWIRYQ